jgi:glutamate racemase
VDTLVLGCTHYPFASHHLQQLVGPMVRLIDNGEPVARQTRRVLPTLADHRSEGRLKLFSTGNPQILTDAAQRWLGGGTPQAQTLSVAG